MTPHPFENDLSGFARDLRSGTTTSEAATRACLERIAVLDSALQAFQALDAERAVQQAQAVDALLASGSDLGPLMGIPVAIKDIVAVEGFATTNGSLYPSEALTGPEGALVKRLKKAGCVILGKTKTVEFALGATGVNEARGTPWNVWDAETHRIPGGSSSGSAVATAAGLCGFAVGTDTGGSVRIPACYNGLFGHKTSMGLWPTDGIFPLSSTLDSAGPLCRTATDAILIHEQLTGETVPPANLNGLRFGLPAPVFFDALDSEVAAAFDAARAKLELAGVEFVEIEIPESLERSAIFPIIVGAELIASLTADKFESARATMDSVTAARAAVGLDVSAPDYIAATRRHRQLQKIALEKFAGIDAWVSPTCPMLPLAVNDLSKTEIADRALLSSRNTQIGNLFGLCAASLPTQQLISGSESAKPNLPSGLQLMMPAGMDNRLLSVSREIQAVIGFGPRPDMSKFI
ncbi:amidase [Chromatiales bacterium (ex Bugula neritina AB1)]|nr:amidase [Chromatiales bacterium (ex Bugula neritina AB1)]